MMTTTQAQELDVQVENHGTVVLFRPLTPAGESWLRENCQAEKWSWFGGAMACEPRFVVAVAQGLKNDGLTCR